VTLNPPRPANAADAVSHGFFPRVAAAQRTPVSLLAIAALGQVILAMWSPALRAQDLRIEHVSIVSPERPGALRDAEVDIHDGRIAAITGGNARQPEVGGAPKPTTINARGLYLTPGLIDSHVHLGGIPGMTAEQESKNPEVARAARNQIPHSFLLYGFTTLVDLISTPSAMARWKSHDPVPDTYYPPGLNSWLEMQHLIEAGLTPRQIFLAATLSNAQALHLNGDVGTVEVGKRANLLLLREDPTKTIQAYAHIVKIILGGRILEPAQLTANHARPGLD
jgi:imidazolonepropionase-like amidohydrolase